MAVIKGISSGNGLEVDVSGQAKVTLSQDPEIAGAVRLYDSDGNPILTTENGSIGVSVDNLLFRDQVEGSALNTNLWQTSVSNFTITQASGYINLNGGIATTATSYAILQSVKYFPMYSYLPLRVTYNAATPDIPQANATMELGIGTVATTAAPTDGAFFRWSNSSEFRCVVNNAGVETTALVSTPPQNDATLFEIVVVEDTVQFLIDDELVAEIVIPEGQSFPTNAGRLPLFARVVTSSTPPALAPILWIGQVIVVQEALNTNRPWSETMAAMGNGAYQSPVTTFAQTSNHANSTSPTSATLSNTAAGYATLGGRYQFAAVAAAATDFALFAYQVPAGFQLFLTGIAVSSVNTGAAVGASGTVLDWSLGVNASAVSLATADGAGTWAPRRIPIGVQGFGTLAVIGAPANDLKRDFLPPVVVDGGRYVHVILQVPVGLATGSEVIRGDVLITGYFE